MIFGCTSDPERDFRQFAAAAESGDRDGLLDGLSASSRAFLVGMLAAAPDGDRILAPPGLPVPVEVVGVSREGDRARLEVREPGGATFPVLMVREGRRFKVCLFSIQQEWAKKRVGN